MVLLRNLKSSRIGRWMAKLVGTSSNTGRSTVLGHTDLSTSEKNQRSLQVQNLVDWYLHLCEQGKRPSMAEAMAIHATAPPTELTALLCADLAQRWQQGEQVLAEQILEQFPAVLAASDHAIDLIYAEYLEREKAGQAATADQYGARFPLFAEELRAQIEFHQALHDPSATSHGSFGLVSAESDVQANTRPFTATDPTLDLNPANLGGHESNGNVSSPPQIHGYDILEEIGRGGMGVVFKARHRKLDRLVALKMLLEGPFSNPSHARRFLVEAKASARLQHPGIVQIHEVGEHEGRPYLAFEYIDGGTLADHIRGRPIQPMAAAAIVEALARAVQFAHERSVVHRDLKPSNVMLQQMNSPAYTSARSETSKSNPWKEGSTGDANNPDAQLLKQFQFKITDFGLAKFVEEHADPDGGPTIAGDIMGTAAYMSPEQARGDSPKSSPASDIYSLGAILYELLTCRPPFVGTRPIDVMAQVVADEPVRPSQLVRRMPADLQTICLKCLEKHPHRRYSSALEMAEELARFQANIPILARRRSQLERGWSWCRRHPVTAISLASFATLLLSISVVTTVYSFLLKDQLEQTKAAELSENDAKKQAIERLWGSYLAEANAKLNSRQIGQRFEGLAAIRSAQMLGDSIELDEQQLAKMREAAIACLALPDVQILGKSSSSVPQNPGATFDKHRTYYAYVSADDYVIVKRCSDDRTIAELKQQSGRSVPLLSADGNWLMVLNDHCRIFSLGQRSSTVGRPFQALDRPREDGPEGPPYAENANNSQSFGLPPVEQIFETKSQGWWAFSSDGTRILGADGGGELKLIDIATGATIRTYGPTATMGRPLFSPNDSKAALVTNEAIEVLDLTTGVTIQRFNRPYITGDAQPCAWHPNGLVLAIGPYETEGVVLWDVVTGAKLDAVGMWGGYFTPYFNSTGTLLLGYANWGASLSVWNTETSQMEFRESSYFVGDPKPTADGGFSFLSNSGEMTSTGVVEPSTVLHLLPKPLGWQATRFNPDVAYSNDGRFFAHGLNGQVLLYETSSMRLLDRVLTGSEWGFVGFDGDGSLLTLTDLGLVRWPISGAASDSSKDSEAPGPTYSFGPPEKIIDADSNVDFAVSSDGRQIVVPTADGVFVVRDGASNNPQFLGPHPDVRSMSFSADGKCLVTGGWSSGTARIWSLTSGELLKTLNEPTCCMVEFSPDGRFLVTNSNRVCIWSVEDWELLSTVAVQGSSPTGVLVCFSPDSRLLAVSDATARIHLVNPTTGKIITTLTNPHEAITNRMAFSRKSDRLAVSFDGSVHVWDLVALHDRLVDVELGWPQSENHLATALPAQGANHSQKQASVAIEAGHGLTISNKHISTDSVSARFVLDQHFQQLAVAEQIQRARIAVERGELSAARILFEQAILQRPESPLNCNNLAWMLATGPSTIRDVKQAEILARRAVASAPDQAIYLNTLGVALYRMGKYAEGITALEKSLSQNPSFNQPYDLLFLAMCHAQLGDSEKARQCQNRASQLMEAHGNGQSKAWHEELNEFSNETVATLAVCERRAPEAINNYD